MHAIRRAMRCGMSVRKNGDGAGRSRPRSGGSPAPSRAFALLVPGRPRKPPQATVGPPSAHPASVTVSWFTKA